MGSPSLNCVVEHLRLALDRSAESDRELLARFTRDHDQEAFADLVRRHGRFVLAACRQVLSDPADVDDAFQATFLVLLRKADSVRWGESLGSWLYAVAHRVAVHARSDAHRRRDREATAAGRRQLEADAADLSWREACSILHEELDRLPNRYRQPLLLCYLEGQSRDEVARNLGWTAGAVKGCLERGRQMLANRLTRRGIALSAGLLAAVAGGSRAAAGPPTDLVRLTLKAAASGASPAVAALSRGAFPMTLTSKKSLAAALLLAALVGAGVGIRQPESGAKERPDVPHAKAPADSPKPDRPAEVTVTGKVTDPDGKPVADAKLFANRWLTSEPTSLKDIATEVVGKTEADGTFRVTIRTAGPPERTYFVAHAAGFGVDWLPLNELPADGGVTFRLVKDVPITGRVVNTEGKPISGVSVSAGSIYVPPDDKLDDYLAGWKTNWRDTVGTPRKRLYLPLDAITGTVTTDKDGRFKIAGAGGERIVHLQVSGAGTAQDTPYVITRSGFDPKSYNQAVANTMPAEFRTPRQAPILNGPDPTFVAEPGMTVEGVVKDSETGKTIAGCRVSILFGFGEGTGAVTDKDGKYTLSGVPKDRRGYQVFAGMTKGSGYLNRRAHVADREGFGAVRMDVELIKGAVVTGRVTDKQTGKGVQCGIRFAPLADNKFFGKKPGYDNYNTDRTMETTDADGRFRLTTIPGRAMVMAQAHAGEKFNGDYLCPYRNAVPEEADRHLFKHDADDDQWTITTAGGLEFLGVENAVKIIDVKEDGETTVDLVFDRGVTAAIDVRDADGKPLAGAHVAGLTEHWPITYKLPEPTATVYALNPEKPRTLSVYHHGKKLGGTVTIRGDEKEPVVIKLAPMGSVKGRLTDVDGMPLGGAEVSVNARGTASDLYRMVNPTGERIVADKEGRFTLSGVVPGIKFYLQIRKGEDYFGGKPKIGLRDVKAGETLDLGDRTMELLK